MLSARGACIKQVSLTMELRNRRSRTEAIAHAKVNSSPADAQYDVGPLLQANSAVAGFPAGK